MDSHQKKWGRRPRPLYAHYEPYAWAVIILAIVAGFIHKAVVWMRGG